jgi:hypothetical protein
MINDSTCACPVPGTINLSVLTSLFTSPSRSVLTHRLPFMLLGQVCGVHGVVAHVPVQCSTLLLPILTSSFTSISQTLFVGCAMFLFKARRSCSISSGMRSARPRRSRT